MAETSGFFDSTSEDIREYSSGDFANFIKHFFVNGVIGTDSLKPSNSNLTLTVAAGDAVINGYWYSNSENVIYNISTATDTRQDRIVLRLDLSSGVRSVSLKYLQGSSDAYPELTQTDTIYDISVCRLIVSSSQITSLIDDRIYSGCSFTADLQTLLEEAQQQVDALSAESDTDLITRIKNNDGSGSGIDADLLDGKEGSYYLNYTNFTNKPIRYGTGTPSSSLGNNGDIYIKYS